MDKRILKILKSSPTKAKILLGLSTGLSIGFSYRIDQQLHILKRFVGDWKEIERRALRRNLYGLEKGGFLKRRKSKDKEIYFELSLLGKQTAKKIKKENSKRQKWDKRWRIIIFDVPEEEKIKRDRFRRGLIDLGFIELQHSVWIYPYDCYEDVYEMATLHGMEHYVSYIVAEKVSRDGRIRKQFNL